MRNVQKVVELVLAVVHINHNAYSTHPKPLRPKGIRGFRAGGLLRPTARYTSRRTCTYMVAVSQLTTADHETQLGRCRGRGLSLL